MRGITELTAEAKNMDILQILSLVLFTFSFGWTTYRNIKNVIEIKKVLSKSSPAEIKGMFCRQIFSSVVSLVVFVIFLRALIGEVFGFLL